MSSPGKSSRWEAPTPEVLQTMLPHYEITGLLGRGGMGAVYRGRQANLDRDIAVKLLPESLSESEEGMNFVARFHREAKAMARLDHPCIISVYDFGETEAGQLYIVMEFVDGMDIQSYLKHHGGQIAPEQALAIVSHVLDALQYAHSNGIVHRDIKPANVLLNREGRVKIADFGLAKTLTAEGDLEDDGLTMSHLAVGTPDFVAPEALDCDQVPDHRADLYAVGVMLYRMLTGKLPRGHYKLPSEAVEGLDPRLDELVNKAMQADPEDRYPDALSIRFDIDEILSVPLAQVQAGDESELVDAVVPLTTTVREKNPIERKADPPVVATSPWRAIATFSLLLVFAAAVYGFVSGKFGRENFPEMVQEGGAEQTPDGAPPVAASTAGKAPEPLDEPAGSFPEGEPTLAADAAASEVPAKKSETPPDNAEDASQTAPPMAAASPLAERDVAKPLPPPSPPLEKETPDLPSEPVWEIEPFAARMQGYLNKRDLEIGELAAKYARGVEQRLERFTRSGDLGMVKMFQGEKDRVSSLLSTLQEGQSLPLWLRFENLLVIEDLQEGSPDELASLRTTWKSERDRIESDLNGKLRQSLQGLEVILTQSQRISEAVAVEQFRLAITPKESESGIHGVGVEDQPEPNEESDTEELVEWLQDREFHWNATKADEVILQFSGKKVTVYVDGREHLEAKFTVLSPLALEFQWGEPNRFTLSKDKRDFMRYMQNSGKSHPGTVRAKRKI